MTALPSSAFIGQSGRIALLVNGRRGSRLAAAHQNAGVANCVVVRGGGRRAGASEALVKELLEAGVSTVVVPALAALHPSPPRALGIVAALNAAGLVVHSLAEPGISSADSATLATVATFLLAAEQRRASKRGSSVIAVVRRTAGRVGRPAKPLTVPVEEARHLVELHGYRRAGALLGLSASSVRRALLKAGVAVQESNQRSSQ